MPVRMAESPPADPGFFKCCTGGARRPSSWQPFPSRSAISRIALRRRDTRGGGSQFSCVPVLKAVVGGRNSGAGAGSVSVQVLAHSRNSMA